jgi:hypothetical protein
MSQQMVVTFDGLLDLEGAARYLNITTRQLRVLCAREVLHLPQAEP